MIVIAVPPEVGDLHADAAPSVSYDAYIRINGNGDLTPANGVDSGSGTPSDPYIIRDMMIKVDGAPGISISNTTSYLNLFNVTLAGGKGKTFNSLELLNSTNIKINNSLVYNAFHGIEIEVCHDIALDDVTVNNSGGGIYLEKSNLISVKNCKIFSNGEGLSAYDNNLVDLQSNDVNNNSGGGSNFNTNNNLTVSSNTYYGNGFYGMVVASFGTNITIIDNDIISSSGYGLFLDWYLNNISISRNNISSNARDGIHCENLHGLNISISGNTLNENDGFGINILTGGSINITDNEVHSNLVGGIYAEVMTGPYILIQNNDIADSASYGLELQNVYSAMVIGNRIVRSGHIGFLLSGSDYGVVMGNNISDGSASGLVVSSSDYNLITDNWIHRNVNGIYMGGSRINVVRNNSIDGNIGSGIYLVGSSQNEFSDNLIMENHYGGIDTDSGCSGTIFFRNELRNNSIYGLHIFSSISVCQVLNNTFFGAQGTSLLLDYNSKTTVKNNLFLDSTISITFDSCENIKIINNYFEQSRIEFSNQPRDQISWSYALKKEERNIIGGNYSFGNYWTNYNGQDIDGDGIGDTDLPHGPGDIGPLVKDPPSPDVEAPYLVDLTREEPQTGKEFEVILQVVDNRSLFGVKAGVEVFQYISGEGYGPGALNDSISLDKNGRFSLTIEVDERSVHVKLAVSLRDFAGNTVEIPLIYDVEDILPPVIKEVRGEDAMTGSEFYIEVDATDNIGIAEAISEYRFYGNVSASLFTRPENASFSGGRTFIHFLVPPTGRLLNFRVLVKDPCGLQVVSEWDSVQVADVIAPVLSDLNPPTLGGGSNFTFRFGQYDNIGLSRVRLTVLVDGVEKAAIYKYAPFDDVIEFDLDIPPDAVEVKYILIGWDDAENDADIYGTMEVVDVIPPTITDLTSGSPATGKKFSLSFLFDDNRELSGGFIHWWLDSGQQDNISGLTDKVEIPKISENARSLTYRVGAVDSSENWRIIERSLEVMDQTPPLVDLIFETPYTSHKLEVHVQAVDNRDVTEVLLRYSVNDESALLDAEEVDGNFTLDVPPDALSLTLYGSAEDPSGLLATINRTVSVLDGTPPVITDHKLEVGSDGRLSLQLKAGDNRKVSSAWVLFVAEDGTLLNVTLEEIAPDSFAKAYRDRELKGSYEVTFFAMDETGNIADLDAGTYEFKGVDKARFPYAVLIMLLVFIVLIVVFVILNVMNTKRKGTRLFPFSGLEGAGPGITDMVITEE